MVDRTLAIVGLILSLPGVLVMLVGRDWALGTLVLILGLVTPILYKFVQSLVEAPPVGMTKVVVTLRFLDELGRVAHLSKQYRIRPNRSHLEGMVHRNIAGDGAITDLCWNDRPIPVDRIKNILGELEVWVPFEFPTKRGHEFDGKLSYKGHDVLNSKVESLRYCIDFPTKHVSFVLELPPKRPCRRAISYRTSGVRRNLKDPNVTDDGRKITMEVKRPILGSEYVITWEWQSVEDLLNHSRRSMIRVTIAVRAKI